ncbi:MAG TPA: VanZ family protein, partial [Rhizomicrobium sp.]|nr:VanZ family protein [Rhizomicrobium sp.]
TPHPPGFSGILAWDKADHFIAYFGLASMATMVLDLNRRLAWTLLALVLMGGLLEILQGYTGRDPEILDFVANSMGTISGAAIGALFLFLLRDRALVAERPGE